MTKLVNLTPQPPVTVTKATTVMDAIQVMLAARVGAAVVVEQGRVLGMFSERDVMTRVVLEGRNPKTTPVSEVMTSKVITISPDSDRREAIKLMDEKHFRHLPVVDGEGRLLAVLSMRQLMRDDIAQLEQSVGSLESYLGADGIGG